MRLNERRQTAGGTERYHSRKRLARIHRCGAHPPALRWQARHHHDGAGGHEIRCRIGGGNTLQQIPEHEPEWHRLGAFPRDDPASICVLETRQIHRRPESASAILPSPRPFTNHHALPPGPWPPPLASTPVGQPPAVTDCDLRSGGKPGGEEAAAAGVVLGSTIGILVAPCAAGYWEVGRRAWLHGMARSSPPMLPPHPHNPPPPPPVLIH
jgi:hypothetical protein